MARMSCFAQVRSGFSEMRPNSTNIWTNWASCLEFKAHVLFTSRIRGAVRSGLTFWFVNPMVVTCRALRPVVACTRQDFQPAIR